MKERPILFQRDMVRALLAGTKTQTRRLVKLRPGERISDRVVWSAEDPFIMAWHYGQAGDRLWVKETHYLRKFQPNANSEDVVYAADLPAGAPTPSYGRPWRPSIFMSRWMSRITLEIVSVRVERLQDISEGDAIAEGVERNTGSETWTPEDGWLKYPVEDHIEDFPAVTARESYATLWDSINAKPQPVEDDDGTVVSYVSYPCSEDAKTRTYHGKPWRLYGNPWVWRIEFRRVEV